MPGDRGKPPWPGDVVNAVLWDPVTRRSRVRSGSQRVCRLCARPGLPDNRFSWHPRCGEIVRPSVYGADHWLLRRQRGRCALCPTVLGKFAPPTDFYKNGCWDTTQHPPLEIDHRVPLWRVDLMPEPQRSAIHWWLVGNLQALCVPCHRAKTAREAGDRSRARSPQLELVDG